MGREGVKERVLELMEPEVRRFREFMEFQRRSVDLFVGVVKEFAGKLKELPPSDELSLCMIRLVDLLMLLDALKNIKASMNNDYSYYKRVSGALSRGPEVEGEESRVESKNELGFFLATRHSIMMLAKQELLKLASRSSYQRLLAYFAHRSADWFEGGRYVTPGERFQLLRAIPCFLYLMDIDKGRGSMGSVKKVRLDRFVQLFHAYPIVPLYGDMQMVVWSVLEQAPSYAREVWRLDEGSLERFWSEHSVLSSIESIRRVYQEYHVLLVSTIENVREYFEVYPEVSVTETDRLLASQVYDVVLRGMRLLSEWTAKILWQSAWKYAHPNREGGDEKTTEYERAVRYNYTPEEKEALIELVSILKSLESIMVCASSKLSLMLQSSAYFQVRAFLHQRLLEMVGRVAKRRSRHPQTHAGMQLLLRLLSARDPRREWEGHGQRAGSVEEAVPCPGALSGTRLELVRVVLSHILHRPRKYRILEEKDLSESELRSLESFNHQLFLQAYLVRYDSCMRAITDLGELWYREFYLELSNRVQFEIESSLAWNLIDHVLEVSPSRMGSIVHLLNLYDCAAYRALHVINQRFLFDEIASEVNLAFDQLVYKLSLCNFGHYKAKAALFLVDREYLDKSLSACAVEKDRVQLCDSVFEPLYEQRAVRLLGRSLDLNQLIAERTNRMLLDNLDYVISVFEASPITSIVEFEHLFENVRLTHQFMSAAGLQLDEWDDLVSQVDSRHSLDSAHGRIFLHIIFELVADLMPNYVFNSCLSRFVAGPVFRRQEEVPRGSKPPVKHVFLHGSRALNSVFDQISHLTSHFFGPRHVQSILKLLGKDSVSSLIDELVDNMKLRLLNVIKPHISEIICGMPVNKTSLPKLHYGLDAAYEYFRAKTKDIANYPVLVTEVFQHFREWAESLYSVSPNNHSVFKLALHRLHLMLKPFQDLWGLSAGPVDNPTFPIDQTYEFHRIWSALFFLFLIDLPTNERFNKSSIELVGEGFLWAGFSITYLLGQHLRFLSLDFSLHLSHISKHSHSPPQDAPHTHFTLFLHRLNKLLPTSHRILSTLLSTYPLPVPLHFHRVSFVPPPSSDSELHKKFVSSL
ncbi:protein pirA-like [Schistocerca gregaria]|uniref:protein pirA-like n=1 Tax=Schistocerca gregaria TaxID=7010 RepID=UPI00211E7B84|nr:protein pirA-like [Schistocerca gregaria]